MSDTSGSGGYPPYPGRGQGQPTPSQGSQGQPYPGQGQPTGPPAYPQGPGGYPPPPPGGGGYPGYPGYPGGYDERQERTGYSGLAIASFVTGLVLPVLGLVVAVPLGIVALVKMSGTRMKGRWMAIAGIVLSVLWLVGIVALAVYAESQRAERGPSGEITKAGSIDFGEIRDGDCVSVPGLADEADINTTDIDGVPCTDAHNAEAVSIIAIDGSSFPGQDALGSQSSKPCVAAVTRVPNIKAKDYQAYRLVPNEDIWGQDNGHRVVCFVIRTDFGDMTGALQP